MTPPESNLLTLERINTAPQAEAAALLNGLYEHSPWVAEAALAARPFADVAALKHAMSDAVRRAGPDRQLALIRAHPELAGQAMLAGRLMRESSHEQSTSGLTHCSPEELQTLHDLNTEYTARFGWPFVLAVRGPTGRGLTRTEIIATLRQRLVAMPQVELDECLRQIDRIAEIRLHDRLQISVVVEGAAGRAPGRSQAGPHPLGGSLDVSVQRGAPFQPIRFFHRGAITEVSGVHPTLSVLDWLREHARCTGTKEGCNEGDCGACTVVVGELPEHTDCPDEQVRGLSLRTVNACLQFLPTLNGKALFTVEDLKPMAGGALHPVQQAMVECHGSQCGFCTPGFVMSLYQQYEQHRAAGDRPSRQQIADGLSGNLCRCTGYRTIIDAGERMFDLPAVQLDTAPVIAALKSLQSHQTFNYSAVNRHQPAGAEAPRTDHFHAPTTVADLAALRMAHPEARLLAGSTDIGLWVTKQFRDLGDIVYLGNVVDLKRIDVHDDELYIGAGASLETAWRALAERWPGVADIGLRFAGPPVRHAGTLGGNVANGSPIGDAAPVLMALDAQIELRCGDAVRRLPLQSFYTGYMSNLMQPGEFVQGISVPLASLRRQVRAYKISKRHDCDISALCAAFAIDLDGDTVRAVRVACGGMAAIVKRAAATEAALVGRAWNADAVRAAQQALAQDFQPLSDMRASAGYRLQVAQNLLQRFWLETRTVDPLTAQSTRVWTIRSHDTARSEAPT